MDRAHFGWGWFILCPADTTGHARLLFAPLFPFALQCPTLVLLRSVHETFSDIAIHGKIFLCGSWPDPVLSSKQQHIPELDQPFLDRKGLISEAPWNKRGQEGTA